MSGDPIIFKLSRYQNFEFIALQVKNTLDCISFGHDQEVNVNIELKILGDKDPTIGSTLDVVRNR